MPFDPAAIKSLGRFDYPGAVYGQTVDWRAGRVYIGGSERDVQVFDLDLKKNDRRPLATWAKHTNYVSCLALVVGSAPAQVVSGSYDKTLIWWNAESGEAVRTVEAHAGWVRDLVALPDGARLVSCGDDMKVKLWDAATGGLIREFVGHEVLTPQHFVNALYMLAVHPAGKWIASADRSGEIKVWETETGALAQKFAAPMLYTWDQTQRKRSIGGIRSLAFSPDGNRLAAGGIGQVGNVDGLTGKSHVEVWDWQAPKRLFAATADHAAIVEQLRFTPDGKHLLGTGGGNDGGFLGCLTIDPLPAETSDADVQAGKHSAVPVTKQKFDGHGRRLDMNAEATRLVCGGHRKAELFSLDGTE